MNPSLTINIRLHKINPGTPVSEAAAREMLNAAHNLIQAAHGHSSDGIKQNWFGACGKSKTGEIDERAKKIDIYLTGLKTISLSCAGVEGSIAAYNQKDKEKVEGGAPLGQLDKLPLIILNQGFHSDRYSWGEKVCSIVHEITHMTIGTSDEKYGGDDAYGAVICEKLAAEKPDDAYKNADNWAYYFGSYYDHTPDKSKDWRYMTSAEVAKRPPL
jgi:Lysine-specific metallo-endopeptidase